MYKVLPEDASDRLGEELQRWLKFIKSDCTDIVINGFVLFFNSDSTEGQAMQSTNWIVSVINS